jgi:hypothetical protein
VIVSSLSDVESALESAVLAADREVAVLVANEVAAEAATAAASATGGAVEVTREAARVAAEVAAAAEAEQLAASTVDSGSAESQAIAPAGEGVVSASPALDSEEEDPKEALRKHLKDITILLGSRIDTLNITYNCVFEGRAIITVTLPLLPRGEVSFSYFKICQTAGSSQKNMMGYDFDDYFVSVFCLCVRVAPHSVFLFLLIRIAFRRGTNKCNRPMRASRPWHCRKERWSTSRPAAAEICRHSMVRDAVLNAVCCERKSQPSRRFVFVLQSRRTKIPS